MSGVRALTVTLILLGLPFPSGAQTDEGEGWKTGKAKKGGKQHEHEKWTSHNKTMPEDGHWKCSCDNTSMNNTSHYLNFSETDMTNHQFDHEIMPVNATHHRPNISDKNMSMNKRSHHENFSENNMTRHRLDRKNMSLHDKKMLRGGSMAESKPCMCGSSTGFWMLVEHGEHGDVDEDQHASQSSTGKKTGKKLTKIAVFAVGGVLLAILLALWCRCRARSRKPVNASSMGATSHVVVGVPMEATVDNPKF